MRPVVTDGIAWSVGLSVTNMSPAKTAEPIDILFGMLSGVGPRKHVLEGVHIPMHKGKFHLGKGVAHCKV